MSCAAPPTGDGFLTATLAHLDCQAQTIGEAGYQALANPGSPVSMAVTALLAIFVAVIGVRFMIGRPMGAGDLVGATLKVGFVLVLTASWPAYRTVVYDVVLKGPAEIAGSIGQASALPGSNGGLAARLQGVDNGIMLLVEAGSGRLDFTAQRTYAVAPPLADHTALAWGKTLFVSSILGSVGLLRLAGGLFLALAPLLAGFLLFDATRFLFFGWLRALIAIALGSIGIAIVLGVQLAILEPWLGNVLSLRAARVATLSAPFELLAIATAFSIAMLGMLVIAVRIGFATAIGTKIEAVFERGEQGLHSNERSNQSGFAAENEAQAEQSRAQIIAQSVNHLLRRETGADASPAINASLSRNPFSTERPSRAESPEVTPLGRTYHGASRRIGAQALKRKPAT
jgi:type IV secretion system protein VirB6